jgi:hypothetical protein
MIGCVYTLLTCIKSLLIGLNELLTIVLLTLLPISCTFLLIETIFLSSANKSSGTCNIRLLIFDRINNLLFNRYPFNFLVNSLFRIILYFCLIIFFWYKIYLFHYLLIFPFRSLYRNILNVFLILYVLSHIRLIRDTALGLKWG